jgi:hypothetical protein
MWRRVRQTAKEQGTFNDWQLDASQPIQYLFI